MAEVPLWQAARHDALLAAAAGDRLARRQNRVETISREELVVMVMAVW